jgi:hypothetical protein
MIEREIQNKSKDGNYKYEKKDPNIYSLLQKYGDESLAIRNAIRLQKKFPDKNFDEQKPCTHVNELVGELENPEDLLK